MKDKLDKRILVKSLQTILRNKHPEIKVFRNNKTEEEIEEILKLVYHSQAESIRNGIENGARIRIPILGQLKIKDTRLYAKEQDERLLEEYGVKKQSELTNIQKIQHKKEMSRLMREKILSKKLNKDSSLTFK